MDNFEKIEKLEKLKSSIEKIDTRIYYINHSTYLTFGHYVSIRCGESQEKEMSFEPSDNFLLNIKEVAIKILKEEIAEMQKEIESIFASWSGELE